MTAADVELAERFTEHRPHLLAVAYRLTGSVSDAEDAVQESWLRLSGLDPVARADIRDLRGWLTTVAGRISLDRLRSATVRRERYVGPWLPEPLVTPLAGDDPLDAVVRDDGVRLAALVVLDRLTPEQRVAFVLHDAFDVPYADIAATLGCAEATARQHASRGRRAVADADVPPRPALAEQREVLERFLAAMAAGDLAGLVDLLHPDAVLIGDGGGKARTARNMITGADKIARFTLGLLATYGDQALLTRTPVLVNGDLGAYIPEQPATGPHRALSPRVNTYTIHDGRITAIYDIVNPEKLAHLRF